MHVDHMSVLSRSIVTSRCMTGYELDPDDDPANVHPVQY